MLAASLLAPTRQPENRKVVAFCRATSEYNFFLINSEGTGDLLPRKRNRALCLEAEFVCSTARISKIVDEPGPHGVKNRRVDGR